MRRSSLLLLLMLVSKAFGISDHNLYVEGEVEKIERDWVSDSYAGLPYKVAKTIWLKVNLVKPTKKVVLEKDTWIEEGLTHHGKGYRLETIDESEVSDAVMRSILEKIAGHQDLQSLEYFGRQEDAQFIIRARRLWNRVKGPVRVKGVVFLRELPGSDPELVFTPAEIRHGDQLIQRKNYREFFSDSPVTPHLNSSRETGSEGLFINTEDIAH